ncbi:MAG: methylmalonyl Co-A mutase-associated GTPase MeaB [Nitrospiria bacterium]
MASIHPIETSVQAILSGDVRAVSKLLTRIEDRRPEIFPLLKALYPYTGRAKLLGVTGPVGVGKSTLINRLIDAFREKKRSIGVLAVDPSSPFTGGAILGDRLRMHRHFLDQDVFIRSFSARGWRGGLGPALFDAILVLDAMGKDIILIETIGVGQDEVQIVGMAETVLLVLAPGMGDEVQAMKAGLYEIGDVIVVNKGDFPESAAFFQQMKTFDPERKILKVSAEHGSGIGPLFTHLGRTLKKNHSNPTKKRAILKEALQSYLHERFFNAQNVISFTDDAIDPILLRKADPYGLVDAWCLEKGINGNRV